MRLGRGQSGEPAKDMNVRNRRTTRSKSRRDLEAAIESGRLIDESEFDLRSKGSGPDAAAALVLTNEMRVDCHARRLDRSKDDR